MVNYSNSIGLITKSTLIIILKYVRDHVIAEQFNLLKQCEQYDLYESSHCKGN